jgi:hypothetical protein
MPNREKPVLAFFPFFQNAELFDHLVDRIPGAFDSSHPHDTCPSICIPGATLWIRDENFNFREGTPEDHEMGDILIEFHAPKGNGACGILQTADVDLVLLCAVTYSASFIASTCLKVSGA